MMICGGSDLQGDRGGFERGVLIQSGGGKSAVFSSVY